MLDILLWSFSFDDLWQPLSFYCNATFNTQQFTATFNTQYLITQSQLDTTTQRFMRTLTQPSKAKEIRDASGRNNCLVDLRTMMFKQRDSQLLLNTHAFM